jgi:hypothetical protein
MIKESKDIDFYTSGRQASEQDFARISEWILNNKKKEKTSQPKLQQVKKRSASGKFTTVQVYNCFLSLYPSSIIIRLVFMCLAMQGSNPPQKITSSKKRTFAL